MVTHAISTGFDWLYPLRVLAAAVVLWCYRRQYDCLRMAWSWPAIGLATLAFGLWMVLVPAAADREADAITAQGLSSLPPVLAALWLTFRIVGAVVTVPIAEELAFRGYLLRRLVAADFQQVPASRVSLFAFLISSALFGMLHASWLAGMAAGMIYALAVYRRGRLQDAVLAHATTNALLAVYILATGHWTLWS